MLTSHPLSYAWTAIIRDPLIVSRNQSVQEAIALMRPAYPQVTGEAAEESGLNPLREEARAGCVLVVEGDRLVGLLTTQNRHQWVAPNALPETPIAMVMQTNVITLPADTFTNFFDALHIMQRHQLHYLPLVDTHQRPVGLLALYWLTACLEQQVRQLEAEKAAWKRHQQTELELTYQHLQVDRAEPQQADVSLQHNETTNHTIVEAIPDLLIRMTVGGSYLDLRSGSTVQVIYPKNDIRTTTVCDILPPDLAQQRLHYAQLASTTGQMQVYEQVIEVNGHKCYEEIRVTPCGEQEVLVMVRDISDRKQTEMALLQVNQELKESDRKFRAIFHNSFQLIGLLAPDGTLLEVNDTALQFAGVKRESILHRPFWETFWWQQSETIQTQLQKAIRQAAQDNFVRYETEVWGSGNQVAIFDFSLRPIKDDRGNVVLLISEGRDITGLKQTEAALRQSEAQSRAVLAAIPDLMFRMSREGKYLAYVTPRREKDVLPTNISFIGQLMHDVLPADLVARQDYWLNKALDTGELQIYEQEVQIGDRQQYEEVRIVKSGDNEVLFMIRDITEQQAQRRQREQAEAALRQLNQSLEAKVAERTEEVLKLSALHRAIVDGTDYAIISTDVDGIILSFNAAAQQMLGYTPAELVGRQTPVQFHQPEELQQRAQQLAAELGQAIAPEFEVLTAKTRRGIVSEEEWLYVRRDGTTFPVLLSMSVLMDADENIIGFVGIAQDITQRKQAEAERDRLLSVLEAGLNEVYIFDAATLHFCYANTGALNNLGYSLDTLKTLTPADITPDFTEAEFREVLCPLLDGTTKNLVFESQHQRVDGSRYPTEAHLQCHNPDGNALLLAVVLDITERKHNETQLRNLSDRLELAVKAAQIGIWDWDIVRDRLLWDDRMYELYGMDPHSPETHPLSRERWQACLHPEDAEAIDQTLQLVLKAPPGEAVFDPEFRVCLPDEVERTLQAYSIVQYDNQDQPQRMIGINFDISDRKAAERRLQEQNEELARATRLKDEFLANMSHELRTPLNAVLGMTEAFQEGIFGEISDRQQHALQTIHKSGLHLLELINDILDLAKIGSGQIELHDSPINISALCHASLAFIEQQAIAKQLHLAIELLPGLPELMADERRIRQVLINLLSNAVKFTPDGGKITLSVTTWEEPPLADGSSQQYLQFAIQDTGIGIAPEHLCLLFQPFTQIDSALNRQYDGTGLGLALVKQIVELHHGSIGVSSTVGEGSRFYFNLPYTGASLPASSELPQTIDWQEANSPSPSTTQPQPLILLVEDNDANVSTISSYLKAKGCQIIRASNGEEAIALTRTHQPDVILMDIQMPGMDGLTATRQIRQQPQSQNIPIIALTALAMEGDREAGLMAGVNEYLTKPVQLRQLVSTIHKVLATPASPSTPPPLTGT